MAMGCVNGKAPPSPDALRASTSPGGRGAGWFDGALPILRGRSASISGQTLASSAARVERKTTGRHASEPLSLWERGWGEGAVRGKVHPHPTCFARRPLPEGEVEMGFAPLNPFLRRRDALTAGSRPCRRGTCADSARGRSPRLRNARARRSSDQWSRPWRSRRQRVPDRPPSPRCASCVRSG